MCLEGWKGASEMCEFGVGFMVILLDGWRTRRMYLKSKPIKELRVSVKYRASLLESKTTSSLGPWIMEKQAFQPTVPPTPCADSLFGEYHYSFIPRLIS